MPSLVVYPGTPNEWVVSLTKDSMLIGRSRDSDVLIADDSLSRQHARIEMDGGKVLLRDLKSKNGTFVNGARTDQRELSDGDLIRCGNVELQFTHGETILVELSTETSQRSLDDLVAPREAYDGLSALRLVPEAPADRAERKLRILLRVGEMLGAPQGIDGLLTSGLDLLFAVMDVDRAAVLLADDTTGQLEPRMVRCAPGHESVGPLWSRRIVEHVAKNGAALLCTDAATDPRFLSAASVFRQSIRSSACVPLKPRDRVIGVLYADNVTVPNRFTHEDLEFLTAFANQIATAIDNWRLYERLEQEALQRHNLMRFFPPTTAQKLLHSDDPARLGVIEAEVTALFSDISGFTSLSTHMEPREVIALLNDYFPQMAEIVFRYEGTLEKYIGDALLAVWGAPYAHEDDPDRAVEAAVDMQRAARSFATRWSARCGVALEIHIGINTGQVAAGNIGSPNYLQYATIGDTTNVASRVCSVAGPGEVVISAATHAGLRRRRWPLEAMPPAPVKGKAEPLQLYRVQWAAQAAALDVEDTIPVGRLLETPGA